MSQMHALRYSIQL